MSHRIVLAPIAALLVFTGALPSPSFAQHLPAPTPEALQVRAAVATLGRNWNPSVAARTAALYVTLHQHDDSGIRTLREVGYGPLRQQKLDLFAANQGFDQLGPVIVFLHDGDDKLVAGTGDLLYSNVGKWAARVGGVGINANSRPNTDDVRLLLDWARRNVAQHGGDPRTILAIGSGQGAELLSRYLFDERAQPPEGPGIAGAILSGGSFAPADLARIDAYRGKAVPILLWSADLDPVEAGVDALKQKLCAKYGACPMFALLTGHNHVSPAMSIDSSDTSVMSSVVRFYHSAVHK